MIASADLREWRQRATQWLLVHALGARPYERVFLGDRPRAFVPYARVFAHELWDEESLSKKVASLLRRQWQPSEILVRTQAQRWYKKLYFGDENDCGLHLAILNDWHLRRDWTLDALTEADNKRAAALAQFTVLTRLRYEAISGDEMLRLSLASRFPYVTDLVYPLVAKMPVISLMHFLDLHVHFSFNSVRRSKHPHADAIVSYLYEILFLQQKTALALLEFARLMSYAEHHKKDAQMIRAEVDAIMHADALFTYLKASIEKAVSLVGFVYGIVDLGSKKEHKKRVAALKANLPPGVEDLTYGAFLLSMIESDNMKTLNNYRNGLLHQMGISDLQPHNFVGREARTLPLRKVFDVLHEQHTRNTALLLVVLALLTDELVKIDPPPFSIKELPTKHQLADISKRLEKVRVELEHTETDATNAIERARGQDQTVIPGELYATRADARFRLGRPTEALPDYREAIARGAELPADIHYEAGRAFMDATDEGKDRSAIDALTRAIAGAPTMTEAYLVRALAYENLGDAGSAVNDLDFVISRVPRPATLLEKRGLLRGDLGRPNEALEDFDAAMSLGHESLDLLTGRGVALRALGRPAESLVALNRALELYPDAVVARLQRAMTLMQLGDLAGSRSDLDHVIQHGSGHRKHFDAFAIRASLRHRERDYAGAAADMEKALDGLDGRPAPSVWVEFLAELRDLSQPS